MQKKLIALAVASLASGAAFAQTNVTMYGVADAGYVYQSGSGDNDFSGINSGLLSGSRIGFRGEEALGNGLRAVFTLEYSLDITNNSGVGYADGGSGLNARQQFVGLAGNWGTVALGRQYSPGYQATANNDPLAGAAFESQSYLSSQAGYSITPNTGARWNNAATFTTANYGGFTGKAIYAWGEISGKTGKELGDVDGASKPDERRDNIWDDGAYGLGANYANGPLNLDAVWQSRQYRRTPFKGDARIEDAAGEPRTPDFDSAVNGADTNEWYVGGSFDLKFVKLMASYQDQDDKNTPNNDSYLWSLGAVIPIGSASNIHLAYANLNYDQGSGTWGAVKGANKGKGYDRVNGDTDSATVAFTHNLSKRTTLYAGYVWTDNNKSEKISPVTGAGDGNDDSHTFLAGMRHSF